MQRTLAINTLKNIGKKVLLAGSVNTKRDHGKVSFIDLRDRTGIIQAVSGENFKDLKTEDIIEVLGIIVKRDERMVNPKIATGTVEVRVEKVKVLSKAAELPFDLGKDDLDVELPTLLDNRSLTLRHPKVKAIFKVQETIVQTFRKTLKDLDFVEFQAPTIVATATEGGAQVFPVKYFDHTVYLAQSPQFYKQIMVSVFERVFTVAHAYRAEPSVTTRHITEYIGLDAEMGFIENWEEIMETAEYVVKEIFKEVNKNHKDILKAYNIDLPKVTTKTPRLKLREAQEIIFQKTKRDIRKEPDLDPEGEKEIWQWAREEKDSDLVFITHYPTKKRPMYTQPDPDNSAETLSFDLIGRGQEWITGGQRINDYKKLVENIKKWGCDPKNFEIPYLQAFKYGMPKEGGFCLGLERLTMNILGLKNIREATLFPRDMERVDIRLSQLRLPSS